MLYTEKLNFEISNNNTDANKFLIHSLSVSFNHGWMFEGG